MTKVFLSYSIKSNIYISFIEKLQIELENNEIQVINTFENMDFQMQYITPITSTSLINKCDLIIAFLTESDLNNPNFMNVIYELGYAMGKGKKILIVADASNYIPFDLRYVQFIQFSYNDSIRTIFQIIDAIDKMKLINKKTSKNNVENFMGLFNLYYNNPIEFEQIEAADFVNAIYEWLISKNIRVQRNLDSNVVGYDLLLNEYKKNQKTLIEVKKYNINKRVSVGILQKFLGAIYFNNADSGIFISSSGFTDSAIHFAKSTYPQIELWDMEYILANL